MRYGEATSLPDSRILRRLPFVTLDTIRAMPGSQADCTAGYYGVYFVRCCLDSSECSAQFTMHRLGRDVFQPLEWRDRIPLVNYLLVPRVTQRVRRLIGKCDAQSTT